MDNLQWGNRKRLRCVKSKAKNSSAALGGEKLDSALEKKNQTSRTNNGNNNTKDAPHPHVPSPHRLNRVLFIHYRDVGNNRLSSNGNHQKATTSSFSPEKDDKYNCTTRRSIGLEDNSKMLFATKKEDNNNNKKMVWPRLLITLSSKEKEEDFMAMKGCKLPQRPKKRAKLIQKTILFVSPGTWLSDLCKERYEVREKKNSKKKPRGLKAMGNIESDSE